MESYPHTYACIYTHMYIHICAWIYTNTHLLVNVFTCKVPIRIPALMNMPTELFLVNSSGSMSTK